MRNVNLPLRALRGEAGDDIPGFFLDYREVAFFFGCTKITTMKSVIKRFGPLILFGVFILTVAYCTVFGERGVLHLRKLRTDLRSINEEIARMTKRNERVKAEIRLLQSDEQYIEAVARKELGMVRRDELVYKRIK